jgi:hypothetical protein
VPAVYLYPALVEQKLENRIRFTPKKKLKDGLSFDQMELIKFVQAKAKIKFKLPETMPKYVTQKEKAELDKKNNKKEEL